MNDKQIKGVAWQPGTIDSYLVTYFDGSTAIREGKQLFKSNVLPFNGLGVASVRLRLQAMRKSIRRELRRWDETKSLHPGNLCSIRNRAEKINLFVGAVPEDFADALIVIHLEALLPAVDAAIDELKEAM